MNTKANLEFESIFDIYRIEQSSVYSFEWKHTFNPITITPEEFICEGKLHSKTGQLEGVSHYILTLTELIACNVSHANDDVEKGLANTKELHYLRLENPILKVREKECTLVLISNGKVQLFICDSKKELHKWFVAFKKISVLENIKKNYQLGEVIGTGSSGTVKIAKKLGDEGEEYAVKTIPKINYTEKQHALVMY